MVDTSDFLTCSICLERFNEPKILPCHHSFCYECISPLVNNHQVNCPICRRIHDVSNGFVADFRSIQLLDNNWNQSRVQPSVTTRLLENTLNSENTVIFSYFFFLSIIFFSIN